MNGGRAGSGCEAVIFMALLAGAAEPLQLGRAKGKKPSVSTLGTNAPRRRVPSGTIEAQDRGVILSSLRDSRPFGVQPSVETLGYSRSSLPDCRASSVTAVVRHHSAKPNAVHQDGSLPKRRVVP